MPRNCTPSRSEPDDLWDVFLDDEEPEPQDGDFWGRPDDVEEP